MSLPLALKGNITVKLYISFKELKPLYGHPGQVEFPAWASNFSCSLANGHFPRQATFQSNPKGQAGFDNFF